ncbi:MAG: amino acid adenylation domain-containing protein, partial [Thermoanaerobaculia bacterium]
MARLGREAAPPRCLPQEGPETGLRPCTYGQQGLWFLHRLEPGSVAYNLAGAARVRGELGADLLERSFRALVARHELLRSTFEEVGVEPMLRISAEAVLDFRAEEAAEGEKEAELLARLADDGYAPFDLGRGPLLRVRFVSRSPQEHILLLAVHHAVADFWSLAVLLRELGALVAGGGEATLAPLPLRPADWAAWERRRLDGPEGERALAFWREALGDDPPVLDLPTDRPRPAVPQRRGGLRRLRLDIGLVERLAAFGRQQRATLFMTLLAGLQAVLQRSSGQRDLAVGTPVAGRTAPELRPLVGYFVQVLVLRSDVNGQQPFVGILDQARQTALAAFAHGEVPLPFLTERLRPSRSGRSPFFQVMLAFQQAHGHDEKALAAFAVREPGARLVLGGLDLECLPLAPREAQHDFVLHIAETGGGLAAALEYDADLFDGTTAARLLEHLHRLLAGALAAPERPVAEIPLLSEAEEAQVLIEWNDTEAGAPEGLCLHELFEAQVRRTPAAEALVAGETRLTYEELSWRANRLAHFLRRLGIRPEERVGICLGRSARLVESLFAVLKAGGAYVPLDPAYPAERLDFLIGDAAARVVLTEGPDLAVRLGASGARVIDLAVEEEWIAAQPSVNPEPLAKPGHLAYLIYTSGSTGRPKGVAIEHRSPVVLAFWARNVLTPEELSGVLASTSVGFDLSVFEIFVPLAWGGRVILAENALSLPTLPAAGEVRLINTVPSAMAELVRGWLPAGPFTVCLAGEPIGVALSAALAADRRIRRSFNLYGPSEDTTYSTFAQLDLGEPGSPPIGRPVAETRVYLLDPEGRPVPIGVPGELCLAGAGLARGYLDRPDLTAERFVPDSFSQQPGRRLYRTGDMARFRAGGVLDFLGRRDQQVKVRGFRIELGEIESALVVRPEIHEAVAMACEAFPGDVRLVAWVVPALGAEPIVSELRALLERTLPRHAIPSAFVVLDALPRTPHGKVDRRRLPQPCWEMERADKELPHTPVEELLAGIWCDLLRVPQIDRSANFFELGGHSLLAMRMLSRVRETLGINLPFSTVFVAPVLARLAEAVEGARSEPASAVPEPPLVPAGVAGPRPLSFAQERLWFLDQLEPGLPVYNIPGSLRWRQTLDMAALERAFGEIVRRHEILRTRLESLGDHPVQVVEPPGV